MTHLNRRFVIYLRFNLTGAPTLPFANAGKSLSQTTAAVNTAVGSLVESAGTEAERRLKPSKAVFRTLTQMHLLRQRLAFLVLQFPFEASKGLAV